MGTALVKAFSLLISKPDRRVVMVGLSGVGQTTIVYRLKTGEVVATSPTIGFNVETIAFKTVS